MLGYLVAELVPDSQHVRSATGFGTQYLLSPEGLITLQEAFHVRAEVYVRLIWGAYLTL